MPKIATYGEQQVSTAPLQTVQARGLPASAFPLTHLAAGAADLSKGFMQMQQRVDTTMAEEAMVKFEREKNDMFFNPDSGYFNLQGKTAYDGAQDANKALQELQQKYAQTLESPGARAAFEKVAARHVTSGQQDIMRHAAKGFQAWEVATIEAQVENSIENASLYWNDSEKLGVQRALGRQAVIDAADRQGITGDALNEKLQTYESSFARASIEAALNTSSTAAQGVMDQWGTRLEGPDRVAVEKAITAKQKAERTQYESTYAIGKTAEILRGAETRQDVIDAVNEITDPELRGKTMKEALYQFGQRKKAEAEARVAAFEEAQKTLRDGGTAVTFQAQYPEQWERLSPDQQRTIEKGEPIVTDMMLFHRLNSMPDSEFKKLDLTEYRTQIGDSEWKILSNRMKSINNPSNSSSTTESQVGRTRSAQTKAVVEQIFGETKKQDVAQVNAFYAMFDAEYQARKAEKGSDLSSTEFTQLLNDFTRKVTIQRSIAGIDWLSPDKEMDIKGIPAEDMTTLSNYLRTNNIPVTAENLIKAYNMANE